MNKGNNYSFWEMKPSSQVCSNYFAKCPLTIEAGIAQSVATDYGLDDRGVRSSNPGNVKNFLFSTSSRPALGPNQSPIEWVSGTISSGGKQPTREAGHSPPTSAEVKKIWILTSTPSYVYMA
jgi:hypothetical protein